MLAFLAHNLDFYTIFEKDKMDLRIRVIQRQPKEKKLYKYISKRQSSCVMFTKINEPFMEPDDDDDDDD